MTDREKIAKSSKIFNYSSGWLAWSVSGINFSTTNWFDAWFFVSQHLWVVLQSMNNLRLKTTITFISIQQNWWHMIHSIVSNINENKTIYTTKMKQIKEKNHYVIFFR